LNQKERAPSHVTPESRDPSTLRRAGTSVPRNALRPAQPRTARLPNCDRLSRDYHSQHKGAFFARLPGPYILSAQPEDCIYSCVSSYTPKHYTALGPHLGTPLYPRSPERRSVFSMVSGLDASSLHPTSVALELCPFEQPCHQRLEAPVPLVLRCSTVTRRRRAKRLS
jgi:hypothetical protein